MSLVLVVPQEISPIPVKIRVAGTKEAPLWCLADVCEVLEISNPRMVAERLDDDEKSTVSLADGAGGPPRTFVTEPGLYKVIMRSDKPVARAFTRWVCHEVLPTIRLHGCYPAKVSNAVARLDAIQQMLNTLRDHEERIADTEVEIVEIRHIAESAVDAVSNRHGYYSVLGYMRLHGLPDQSLRAVQKHGVRVSRLCKEQNLPTDKTHDARFGRVGTYPESVLRQYFLNLYPDRFHDT